ESVPHLVERLIDHDRGVKTAAARSLEILRWQTDVRSNKARQLVALERWADAAILGDDAVDALVDAFAWKDALTRRRATETLVKIGSSKAVSALRTLASDANEAVREEAKTALVALKSDPRSRQLSSSLQ
ncbi:MAG: HEAT repeat domain-containing protein, partial [Limisphaerales bacterium]